MAVLIAPASLCSPTPDFPHTKSNPPRTKMATIQEPQPGKPCNKCSGFFSTAAALQALASKSGYAHVSGAEVKQTAATGCPICQRLVNVLTTGTARENDRLVFWATFGGKRCQTTVEENCSWAVQVSYPYQFDQIDARAYRDGVDQNWGTSFNVFAAHGKACNLTITA